MGQFLIIVGLLTVSLSMLMVVVATVAAAVLWCGGWLIFAAGLALNRMDRPITVVPGERIR